MDLLGQGVVILHNLPRSGAWSESDAGVLAEVEAVAAALPHSGMPHRVAGIRRLRDLPAALAAGPEAVVVNLVEALDGQPEDAWLVPAACEALARGCTGSNTPCLLRGTDKWQAHWALRAHGIPTPPAVLVPPGQRIPISGLPSGRLIVKPLQADASEGIDAASVVPGRSAELDEAVRRVHRDFGQPALVEQYIDGREVNVALWQREAGEPDVLPLAEIDFSAFPEGMARIVDYAAKWRPESFSCQHTPRRVPADLPAPVAEAVRRIALAAWHAVGCRDYARVDLRLNERLEPFVLEVNPNPDIAPDAGFAAALEAGGVPYETFVRTVVGHAAARAIGTGQTRPSPSSTCPADNPITLTRSTMEHRAAILDLVDRTPAFRPDEAHVAREVLDAALARPANGEYHSFTACRNGVPVGWVCYGPTPCSAGTWDVYWLAVAPEDQGRGIGQALLREVEQRIVEHGGRLIVAETSGRADYAPARRLYRTLGFREDARLPDFYAPGDDKLIYTRRLT